MLKIECNNPICGTSFFFDNEKYATATKVRCPKCKGPQALPTTAPIKSDNVPLPTPPPNKTQTGWLVIHDEYTETATFTLEEGTNRIGRYGTQTPRDVNIVIHTQDKYMSRNHCNIEVCWLTRENRFDYILMDRNSTNGTFVNAGRRIALTSSVRLNDGDTIQIGRTKLVLKLPISAKNALDAARSVKSTVYLKTIIH